MALGRRRTFPSKLSNNLPLASKIGEARDRCREKSQVQTHSEVFSTIRLSWNSFDATYSGGIIDYVLEAVERWRSTTGQRIGREFVRLLVLLTCAGAEDFQLFPARRVELPLIVGSHRPIATEFSKSPPTSTSSKLLSQGMFAEHSSDLPHAKYIVSAIRVS
jgi:hypothetical protein